MDKLDSFQTLHKLFLSHKRSISLKILADRLECSEKTVRRLLDQMRDVYSAPIEYHPEDKGWRYNPNEKDKFELPGIWLTSSEIQSLGLLIQLLNNLGEGILENELSVIQDHLNHLLTFHKIPRAKFDRLIKIIPINHRQISNPIFTKISECLVSRKQLSIHYRSYNQQQSQRTISPQTLVYYRENWYLDGWCHLRNDLRTFSVARIEKAERLTEPAIALDAVQLQQHFNQGYGIFSGEAKQSATLRFFPDIAREIAQQQWHPAQTGRWEGNDYLLTIPYSDARELIQDILRHVPNVYVESPAALRKTVTQKLQAGLVTMTQQPLPRST